MSAWKNELLDFAKRKHEECKVTVLPDFFLDRIINLDWNPTEFSRLVGDVANRKGGSLDGISQNDLHGGNAVNVALALANLGAEVTPIVCTSAHGLEQLRYYFRNTLADISHVKVKGKASITTALEFKQEGGKTNVMLRDLGALADFGPDDLSEDDYAVMEGSDYTCLFNWAGTLKHGTQLAEAVFGRTKNSGKGKTYFDSADPTPNRPAIPELTEKVLKRSLIDILSVNENEAIVYASLLDETLSSKKGGLAFAELAMEAARVLSKHLHGRIDLHTTAFSATLNGRTEVVVPTFKVKVLRATGAGDAWTAGNIVGDHNGLSDECRLTLANAVSACYLSDLEGEHPTWARLACFLRSAEQL